MKIEAVICGIIAMPIFMLLAAIQLHKIKKGVKKWWY